MSLSVDWLSLFSCLQHVHLECRQHLLQLVHGDARRWTASITLVSIEDIHILKRRLIE